MNLANGALITDLYQLNMMQAYLEHGQTETAVFEFFVRRLPERRGFLVAAGLDQALDFLENLEFSADELGWLAESGRFDKRFLDRLASLRFTGDVHAMREGTVYFPDEPTLRVTAPLPEAQLVETRLINIVHFQSLIAAKAARHMLLAADKVLVDFGLRRAHGAEAGIMAARASYIAGFAGTATMLAGKEFGIPLYGTLAHSFIETYDDEAAAFESFARSRPQGLTLLIDTYDTEAGARKVVAVARRLKDLGIAVHSVRLDSGDLVALSRSVRQILDDGGLDDVGIFASGGIDEKELAELTSARAPIDGFGIGTSLTTSYDFPALDCVYKLQEYAGLPRRKRSAGKATWPGRKQVWRRYGPDGRMSGDVLSLEGDDDPGEPLIRPVMRNGKRLERGPALDRIRAHAAGELAHLPDPLRRLEPDASYPVEVSPSVRRLADEVDRRLRQHGTDLP